MNDLSPICHILQKENNFLISSHIRPEGDSIGSQLAFYLILQKMGKKVVIINEDPVPENCKFLPQSEIIKVYSKEEAGQFDVACILDCNQWDRLGKVASLAKKARIIINIDHHPDSPGLGHYNYLDATACAVGEQLYDLSKQLKVELSNEIALCLYAAIWVDTGGFRHINATPKAHRIAAELIEQGVSPPRVASLISETCSLSSLKLMGLILSSLKITEQGKVASCYILEQMLDQTGVGPFDVETDGLIEQISRLKAEVIVLFRELPKGKIKVSLRSKPGIDVSSVAKLFAGGGHRQAAGCVIDGEIDTVKERVLRQVSKVITEG